MEKYYFDTSVWLAYLNGSKEFYYKEARKWFDKIQNEQNLHTSMLVEKEIRNKYPDRMDFFHELLELLTEENACYIIRISEKDKESAQRLLKSIPFRELDVREALSDALHIAVIKGKELSAVSADYKHWPYLCRFWGVHHHDISSIYTL